MINVIKELTRIVQAVSHTDSAANQVHLIVESISRVMSVDVCSLYLANEQEEMVLAASEGLAESAVGRVKLARGAGLVGLVAGSRHPLNVQNADQHPAYHYIPETGEEQFRSFCGVPLIAHGKTIGVLVVQNATPRRFTKSEEAFLVTLAAQLALLTVHLPAPENPDPLATFQRRGIKSAPGIGIGRAQLSDREHLMKVPDAPCSDPEATIKEWHELLESARGDLETEKNALGPGLAEAAAGIFEAHHMLLRDTSLIRGVEVQIREGNWLPGALRKVIEHTSDMFLAMDDPYLRARHEDILHLGDKLLAVWRGTAQRDPPLDGPVILVGGQVSVSEIASVAPENLAGIVCFEGSSLSHTAILANALGVPAVMGVGPIKEIRGGEELIVDGNEGVVIVHPGEAVRAEFETLLAEDRVAAVELEKLRDEPAVTTDGVRITLYANTGLLTDVEPGLKNGAEGVGLYRTEIPFMIHNTFPTEDQQVKVYSQLLSAFPGKPVYMRTLDVGGDKPLPYFPFEEENPALGWRGIRFCLDNASLLMTQVRAMLRAGGKTADLHILLPMVSSTEELTSFRSLLDNACQQLIEEGHPVKVPRVGVMVEVPAAISMIRSWARSGTIDFLSIGSNDLSQYLLAMDRNNARIAPRYDHLHPAVLHEIVRIVEQARGVNLPLSLCGEMAADPAAVVLLVGMGITTLSMSASKLLRVKKLVRSLCAGEARALVIEALERDSATSIRELVNRHLAQVCG